MLPLVAAGLAAGGTLAANKLMGGNDNTGEEAIRNAIAQFSQIRPPTADDLQVILQHLVYQGDITPDQATTYLQSPSGMSDVQGSPEAKAAQMDSLSRLSGIADAGGMDPQSEAALETVRSAEAGNARGSREAIMQNARERGMGGSGMELLDQLVGSQGAAGNENAAALDIASQARQRSLQALSDTGQLGGQIEGQAFGEQSSKAAASDAINKFNAANLNATEAANVAAKNAAAARNIETKQSVAGTNTAISNDQAKTNATAKQTAYEDQLARARGMSGEAGALSSTEQSNRNANLGFEGGLIGAGGNVLSGYLAGQKNPYAVSSDETKKKDIKDVPAQSLEEFMAHLDPKKFSYKDPNAPGATDGDSVGVMAQDVEKTPVGKTMVKNTKDGKMLDIQKGFEVMLAAIGALHRKLEDEKGAANG